MFNRKQTQFGVDGAQNGTKSNKQDQFKIQRPETIDDEPNSGRMGELYCYKTFINFMCSLFRKV